jgi:HEXXH motif-containing protein
MTARVQEMLDEGGRSDAAKVRFMKLAMLSDLLAPGANATAGDPRGFDVLWDAIASRTGDEVVRRGSPFFWKNVHRCFDASAEVVAAFQRLVSSVIATGFDSYYDWLPDGAEIVLPDWPEPTVPLPELGLSIPVTDGAVMMRRVDARTAAFTSGATELRIDLDNVPQHLKSPAVPVPGHPKIKLLLIKSSGLFEPAYIDTIVPKTPHADFIARMIAKSLEMIEAADPATGAALAERIHWYVPIGSPGRQTHNSFSVQNLAGLIFLSEAYDDVRLAEAMVHEFQHNELYLIQESTRLWNLGGEARLYSPFREDARPIEGLFHALHVFSSVASFLASAERLPEIAHFAGAIRGRRQEVIRQLQIGLLQLPWHGLTAQGKRIMDGVREDIAQFEAEFGALCDPLPERLAAHARAWISRHPELASELRLPPGVSLA